MKRNPRKVVAYLTQYGGWWSATAEQWRKLAAHGTCKVGKTFEARGKTYSDDIDLDVLATRLGGRPSSIRTDSYTDHQGFGHQSFYSLVPIIRPLDFDSRDWRNADEEVQRYMATQARSARSNPAGENAIDVTPAALRGAGVKIERWTVSHAYPKSGNAHAPTPRYSWRVFRAGRLLGTTHSHRAAVLLAQEPE